MATRAKYSPFRQVTLPHQKYDLQLKKEGAIANILGNTIVSWTGIDTIERMESLEEELKILGFKRH